MPSGRSGGSLDIDFISVAQSAVDFVKVISMIDDLAAELSSVIILINYNYMTRSETFCYNISLLNP